MSDLDALERAWRAAQAAVINATSEDRERLIRAEFQAWDAYSDRKDELKLCAHIGCRTQIGASLELYCSAHSG